MCECASAEGLGYNFSANGRQGEGLNEAISRA